MDLEELIKVFERIDRISKRIANKGGEGASWIIKHSDEDIIEIVQEGRRALRKEQPP